MGQTQTTKYSIVMFTSDINSQINTSSKPSLIQIRDSLKMLKTLFINQPKEFENSKVLEKELIKAEADMTGESQVARGDRKIPEKNTVNFTKNLSLVPKLVSKTDHTAPEYMESLTLYLDMFYFLGEEKVFIEFFYLNAFEHLNNIIIEKTESFPNTFINRVVNSLKGNLIKVQEKPKFFNIHSVIKFLHVNVLLLNSKYIANEENLFSISNYLKSFFIVILELNKGTFQKRVKPKEASNLVRTVLIEFSQMGLINCICKVIKECIYYSEKSANILLEVLSVLVNFDFVIAEKLIKIEGDLKELLFLVDPLQNPTTVNLILSIIQDVSISTINNNINDLFFIISRHKRNILERFYLLLKCSEFPEVKLRTAVLLMLLSLNKECWEIMLSKNIIQTVKAFLFNHVAKGLQPLNFNDDNQQSRIVKEITFITNSLNHFCTDKNLNLMKNSDFYVMFFDVVLMLFYYFHKSIRVQILQIFKAFTYFQDCKAMLHLKNREVHHPSAPKTESSIPTSSSAQLSTKASENNSKAKEFKSKKAEEKEYQVRKDKFLAEQINKKIPQSEPANKNLYSCKYNLTEIKSPDFFRKIIVLIKVRISQSYSKLQEILLVRQDSMKVSKYSEKTVHSLNIENNIKELQKHHENNHLCETTMENMKQVYLQILNQFGLLICIFTNLFISDDFEDIQRNILEGDGFINKLKEIVEYFQVNEVFHREFDNKLNPNCHQKDSINQLYLILFMIFPDAKIEFVGEKSTMHFYREENRKQAILMRLLDLLKKNKQNSDFTSKVIFCINRFLSSNIMYKCYNDTILNIVNEFLPFLSSNYTDLSNVNFIEEEISNAKLGVFQGIVHREIYRFIYNLHKGSNNLALYLKADSFKLQKDLSGNSNIMISYKNKQVKHFFIKRNLKEEEFIPEDGFGYVDHSNNTNNSETQRDQEDNHDNYIAINNVTQEDVDDKTMTEISMIHHNRKKENLGALYNSLLKKAYFLKKTKNYLNQPQRIDLDDKKIQSELKAISAKEYDTYYHNFVKFFSKNNPDHEFHPEMILYPPYKKVTHFKETRGTIFHSDHYLVMNQSLQLGKVFTVMVRLFVPCPHTSKFHTLIQSDRGLGGMIVIDNHRSSLGCFTEDGQWIDSGIDFDPHYVQNRWHHVTLCYSEFEGNSKIYFYLNGNMTAKYISEKYILPKNIKYIGNSSDYSEPFGVWCDLKVYRSFLDESDITGDYKDSYYSEEFSTELNKNIYSLMIVPLKGKIMKDIDLIEENKEYFLKLLNMYLSNYDAFKLFADYHSFIKIASYLDSNKESLKNEFAKYALNIS